MKKLYIIVFTLSVFALLFAMYIFTPFLKNEENYYNIVIYIEEMPSAKMQKQLNTLFEEYNVTNVKWNNGPKKDIKKYPTILITDNKRSYWFYNYDEVIAFFSEM